ncbi:MAG: asparaginase [candidate division Zixibacteria bacterium]|nr:asparaginase [Candidatus Tariuqbacter arcticus]
MVDTNPILVEITRGGMVESFHRGAVAVVDNRGGLLASAGDTEMVVFLRSSAKPMQVIPLITCGAAEEFGFTLSEIALMCGSHSGEKTHTDAVESILRKIGLTEKHLKCGVHPPLDAETRRTIKTKGEAYSQLHNNCSAKHAAMLAGCVFRGYSLEDYSDPDHPWQRGIVSAIAELSGLKPGDIILGIDGCNVPVHAMPLYNAALAGAKLARPQGLDENICRACKSIFRAMVENPYMAAGRERICTAIMQAANGELIAKAGAEGFYLAAYKENDRGFGIAVKLDDGSQRGRDPAVIETLRQLGVLSDETIVKLTKIHHHKIINHAGVIVGEVRPVFKLQ